MPETNGTYRPFLDLASQGKTLPSDCNTWGFKIVRRDLTTFRSRNAPAGSGGRFQWPYPPLTGAGVQMRAGDYRGIQGFKVASTLRAATAVSYDGPLLLLAYNNLDVTRGNNGGEITVNRVTVVAVLETTDLLKQAAGYDLSGANLAGFDLAEANLAGANLAGATLTRTRLCQADLSRASLRGANLVRADLTDAALTEADASQATFSRATLANATLDGVNFDRAVLTYAALNGTSVSRANFAGANLRRASLYSATGQPVNGSDAANLSEAFSVPDQFTRPSRLQIPQGRDDIAAALAPGTDYEFV